MKINERDKMQAWVLFAAGALAGIASNRPSDMEKDCDIAAQYADFMLENMEDTFELAEDDDDE